MLKKTKASKGKTSAWDTVLTKLNVHPSAWSHDPRSSLAKLANKADEEETSTTGKHVRSSEKELSSKLKGSDALTYSLNEYAAVHFNLKRSDAEDEDSKGGLLKSLFSHKKSADEVFSWSQVRGEPHDKKKKRNGSCVLKSRARLTPPPSLPPSPHTPIPPLFFFSSFRSPFFMGFSCKTNRNLFWDLSRRCPREETRSKPSRPSNTFWCSCGISNKISNRTSKESTFARSSPLLTRGMNCYKRNFSVRSASNYE